MKKELTAFRMSHDVMRALREIKNEQGIPMTVQLDLAARAWLKRRGVKLQKPRYRVSALRSPSPRGGSDG